MISNDNKFTLKPIFVFLPFLIIHTFIIVMETIYCFFIVVLFRMGWLAWGGGHEASPSAASEVQPVVHGAKSLVSTQENPRLIISSCHPAMLCSFPIYLFFFCYRQSRRMTNTQNTARHSTTESKLHSTRIRELLKKDVWLNNYNALDVVDEDCYTSLRKLQKVAFRVFSCSFFFLNIRF